MLQNIYVVDGNFDKFFVGATIGRPHVEASLHYCITSVTEIKDFEPHLNIRIYKVIKILKEAPIWISKK